MSVTPEQLAEETLRTTSATARAARWREVARINADALSRLSEGEEGTRTDAALDAYDCAEEAEDSQPEPASGCKHNHGTPCEYEIHVDYLVARVAAVLTHLIDKTEVPGELAASLRLAIAPFGQRVGVDAMEQARAERSKSEVIEEVKAQAAVDIELAGQMEDVRRRVAELERWAADIHKAKPSLPKLKGM